MSAWLDRVRKGYGRKLKTLHAMNGWIVTLLSISGLVLLLGFWRGVLGEGRVWLKWAHIGIGIASMMPVIFYLLLAAKHWKQLRGKPLQRFNVLAVLGLLLGWLGSGLLLWQFRAVGPVWSNRALLVHDLLTWIGLPYIIYHSITRMKWLKEPGKRIVRTGREQGAEVRSAPEKPQSVMTRRMFLRSGIAAVLLLLFGPSLLKSLGSFSGSLSVLNGGVKPEQLAGTDANRFVPKPDPLPASSPPIGGGSKGTFRVYTVTPIRPLTNDNWSFTIDGLVERPFTYDWETFVKQKRTVQVSDFHCVTGWSVYKNTWEGLSLKSLLEQAGVKSGATHVKFYSADGVYTDSLTLEQARMDDVMVAMLHDGILIPSELGGPVRLIVPKM